MRPSNINSKSLLKTILPGIISIFVYFSPEILKLLANNEAEKLVVSDLLQNLSPSILILFTAITLVAGKIINFLRLKFLRVPNYFKRTVNHETDDVKSLSRLERWTELFEPELSKLSNMVGNLFLLPEFKKVVDEIFHLSDDDDSSISDESISQNPNNSNKRSRVLDLISPGTRFLDVKARKQIITDIRKKYDLNDTTHPEVFYSIILNDISNSKSKETREIESVYVSYKNTAISFVFVPPVRLYFNLPPVYPDAIFVLILFSSLGLVLLVYAGLFGIGKIHTKQILLEYYAKNNK